MSVASACRDCGATITWGEKENGHKIPLDPIPSRDGRYTLSFDGRQRQLPLAEYTQERTPTRWPLYNRHVCEGAQA